MTKLKEMINTYYCPPYQKHRQFHNNIRLRINIQNETIYHNDIQFENYTHLYNYLKDNDKSEKWLSYYYGFLYDTEDIYLNNMIINLRKRYNITLDKYEIPPI